MIDLGPKNPRPLESFDDWCERVLSEEGKKDRKSMFALDIEAELLSIYNQLRQENNACHL